MIFGLPIGVIILLKLRQICCSPALLKLDNTSKDIKSAKQQELMTLILELLDENRKILLFSSFASMINIIESELINEGICYSKLIGNTTDRQKEIVNFQEGITQIFLISLKAGGVGLNLTEADTVIHYDPWWNPAAEEQATERAYRIGQNKPVFVYKLIAKDTIEEKVIDIQTRKKNLISDVLEPGSIDLMGLTLADLNNLFSLDDENKFLTN